jgi:hypothetical protein
MFIHLLWMFVLISEGRDSVTFMICSSVDITHRYLLMSYVLTAFCCILNFL